MVSIPSRSRLLSSALRRDLALRRYGRGANLVAMTGVRSNPPSRNISPMILSEAPLPYISAVSTTVTPSAMLVRKAFSTSLRSYSLPYPHSLLVPHAQAPTPRGATFSSSARTILDSFCSAAPPIHSLLRTSILQLSSTPTSTEASDANSPLPLAPYPRELRSSFGGGSRHRGGVSTRLPVGLVR